MFFNKFILTIGLGWFGNKLLQKFFPQSLLSWFDFNNSNGSLSYNLFKSTIYKSFLLKFSGLINEPKQFITSSVDIELIGNSDSDLNLFGFYYTIPKSLN